MPSCRARRSAFLIAGLSLPAMTLGGLIAGVIVAVLSGLVTRYTVLKEDASLATFYLMSLALGVTIVSVRGSNVDLMHVLFGTVLALNDAALTLIAAIASVDFAGIRADLSRPRHGMCRSGLSALCQPRGDALAPRLSRSRRAQPRRRISGTGERCLPVGLMMLPAATARFWSADVTVMVLIAVIAGMLSGAGGLLLSYHHGLPAGPAIILVAGLFYLASLFLGRESGLVWSLVPRRHLEA